MLKKFEKIIRINHNKDLEGFVLLLIVRLSIITILGVTLIELFKIDLLLLIGLVIFSFIALIALEYYSYNSKIQKFENTLPDILLFMGMQPKGTAIDEMLKVKSIKANKEFEKAINEINNGKSLRKTLDAFCNRFESKIINQTISLIIQAHETGGDFRKAFTELANELVEIKIIEEEKKTMLAVQKYTIILGCCFLIPLCLGLVAGITKDLDFKSLQETTSNFLSPEKLEWINKVYIIEFAVSAGIFIALLEGQKKNALMYIIVMTPIALIIYSSLLIR